MNDACGDRSIERVALDPPHALVDALLARLEERQSPSGLFPITRLSGEASEIDTSPFGATFVAHVLARIAPAFEGERRTRAETLLERTRAALRRAPDADGRVRFFGPGSSIRPDVDDTACVWSALLDAGTACPEGVLDAIASAALPEGGFANDFDTRPPAAVELASSAMAMALLYRSRGDMTRNAEYVEAKVTEIQRGVSPFGFFFPSRFYAAFVVTRAAVDHGVRSLRSAAMRLSTWIASVARAEGPLLERALALWVLEATGGAAELRAALRRSCIEDARTRRDPDPWFIGDPRSIERTGLEVFGCTAVADAILLDAFVLPLQPSRRLLAGAYEEAKQNFVRRRLAPFRRLVDRDAAARFEVATEGATAVVEVVPDAPGVRAYCRVGKWAVRYAGADGAVGARAADLLIDAGLDLVMAQSSPNQARELPICRGGREVRKHLLPRPAPCRACLDAESCEVPAAADLDAYGLSDLRPRRSDESLADLLRLLTSASLTTPELLSDIAALRAAVDDPRQAELEVSFKAEGESLIEGPRVTFYQHRPETFRVLDTFATLAGGGTRDLVERLAPYCRELPLHIGCVHGSSGRSYKLYVRTDASPEARLRKIVETCTPGARLDALASAPIHGVGIASSEGRIRLRLYVIKKRGAAGDPRADSHALEGWDLTPTEAPALESNYVHYRAAHLSWADAVDLAGFGPELASRLGRALSETGRWYARFIGLPVRSRARSLYLTIGPRVPRMQDDGP